MALRPSRKHIPKLTVSQVLEIRDLYFDKNYSLRELAYNYDVSKGLIQKAVHGIGKYYGSIEDDIPQDVKDNRKSAKEYRGEVWEARRWAEEDHRRRMAEEDRRMREEMIKSKAEGGMLWECYGHLYKDLQD